MPAYTGPETTLTPDEDMILRHLEWLFGEESEGKFALAFSDATRGKEPRISQWYDVSDLEAAAAKAAEMNARAGCSAFVRPCIFPADVAPFGWPSDDDFGWSRVVWAETDNHEASVAAKSRYKMCPANAVVITSTVDVDGNDQLRAHYYWRLAEDEIIENGQELSELNGRIGAALAGDTSVRNPTRLMRLAGTINWAWKPGRVPELCALHIYEDRARYGVANIKHGFGEPAPQIRAAKAAPDANVRGMFGELRPNILKAKALAGEEWHNHVLRLVAHLQGKGAPEAEIVAIAPEITLPGFTVEQTVGELLTMIRGGRAKGYGPANGGPQPQIEAKPAPDVTAQASTQIEWFHEVKPVLTDAYLVKGVLAAGAMSVVYGPSNSGKTFFALDLAFHAACGARWRDRRVNQTSVLYLAAEGGNGIANRIVALKESTGILDEIPFALRRAGMDLHKNEKDLNEVVALSRLVQEAAPNAPHLIVIDTLSRVMAGGNENAPEDMTALIRNLDAIRAATNAHVMLVHHTGKDTAKGARGHSSLRAATDTEIEIEQEDEDTGDRVARVTKQRDYEGNEKWAFQLKVVDIGADQDGDLVTSCLVQEAKTSERKTGEIDQNRLTDNQKIFVRAYQDLITLGRSHPLPDDVVGAQSSGRIAVTKSDHRTAFNALMPGGSPRNTYDNAFKSLIHRFSFFGVSSSDHEERIWPTKPFKDNGL